MTLFLEKLKRKFASRKSRAISLIFMGLIVVVTSSCKNKNPNNAYQKTKNIFTENYDISTLNNSAENKQIKEGYELFKNTPKYLGPNNKNTKNRYTGNELSCNNCHLDNGTKPYAAPLLGIINRFPQYRGREDKIGTIEDRINGCFERSLNGKILPIDSDEMKAFVSYLNWLNRYAPKDGKVEGQGFVKITIPNRAINTEKGKTVYTKNCVVCHGENGAGIKNVDEVGYIYPPLWGNDSYNNGAGMNRVITAAQFIKANMPLGATNEAPILTDNEAFDVAGYINQMSRPIKQNLELDFPDLKKKPVSTPYPPYLDTFSIEQHQKGPFQPIIKYYKETYNIQKSK